MKRLIAFGLILGAAAFASATDSLHAAEFTIDFNKTPDRVWVGADFWANRLQDWRVQDGRLECVTLAPQIGLRTVHVLTHRLSDEAGPFELSAQVGADGPLAADSSAGFLVGVGGEKMDYRSAALIQMAGGPGGGIYAGIDATGRLFIVDNANGQRPSLADGVAAINRDDLAGGTLTLKAEPTTDGQYQLTLSAGPSSVTATVSADRLIGNVALACIPGKKPSTKCWFDDLKLSGTKVAAFPGDSVGPILSTQYTLSNGVMKMTAQLMPIATSELKPVELQAKQGDDWKTVAKQEIIVPGWTATFRIADWDDTKDTSYRVVLGSDTDSVWAGTVRKDPVDKKQIVVAGFTGNHNNAHSFGKPGYNYQDYIYFPHQDISDAVMSQEPDLLFFSGDQVYEGASPTFPDRGNGIDVLNLDYLYKWYLWCWAYRDMSRDIPTITIPDDHDVYQGNLWGAGGRNTPKDDKGGYVHPAEFVKLVERTQVANLPDPYDPEPLEQGIKSYYTGLNWGRIGFAVLEDRKFKSGCNREDMPLQYTINRADHYNNPKLDPAVLDINGLELLGKKQEEFLGQFAKDWKGQDMKCALSQTVFAAMATHHGGGLQRLICDLDSNGWPQKGRDRAVDALRRGFIFHLAGDQHLASLVHHGIDEYDDAIWSFCVPSICNFYPRAFAPEQGLGVKYQKPTFEEYSGKREDGFGHLVNVYAVTNPGDDMGHEPKELHNKMPGYGIVRFNKPDHTITVECWPRYADPTKDEPYAGWPRTIDLVDNYSRKPAGLLETVKIDGVENAVVQVYNEKNDELVYALRIRGNQFTPWVFEDGSYTVKIGDPDTGKWKSVTGQTIK